MHHQFVILFCFHSSRDSFLDEDINDDVKLRKFHFFSVISSSSDGNSIKMLAIKEIIEDTTQHTDDLHLIRHYERRQLKLGKRLAYLLRYGAEKEGLRVAEGEFNSFSP